MSKTKPEIAKAILERRNRMTHVIMPGEINAAIGADGVSEALKQRWLVPDMDSGYLCATNDLGKIEEMRKLADMKAEEYKPEPIPVCDSHDVALMHTTRERRLNEIAAPMTGKDSPGLGAIAQPQSHDIPSAPQAPVTTPQGAPPPAAPSAATMPGQPGVGSPVTVSRNGVQLNGMIEKLMPDGRYQVQFPPNTPGTPSGDNVFTKDQLSVMPGTPQGT